MIRSFLSVFSKGVRSPLGNSFLRPVHGLAKSVYICTLVALSINPQAFAQTPVSDNYLAIVFDNGNYPERIDGIQKDDSTKFFGMRDNRATRFTLTESGLRFFMFTLATEPQPGGGSIPLSSPSGHRGSANLTTGNAYRLDGGREPMAGQVWEMSGPTPVQTQLNVLTAPLFGLTPGDTATAVYATDQNLIVGMGGPREPDGPYVATYNHALAWVKTANGFGTVNLHQVAGLLPNTHSSANGVADNVIVGGSGDSRHWSDFNVADSVTGGPVSSKAIRWDRNPATGTYTSRLIHPAALLGNNSSSVATDVNGGIIVGTGFGTNTGWNSNLGWSAYFWHALRWSGTEVVDLHQASGMNAYLGAQGQSVAEYVSGNVSAGSAMSPNFGPYYWRHAIRWSTSASGVTSFLDLQTFMPAARISAPQTHVRGIASDGTILGAGQGFSRLSPSSTGFNVSVLWKPLISTGIELMVPEDAAGYIVKPFTQSAGSLSVYGFLDLDQGANGPITYTITGGVVTVHGGWSGSVVLDGGTFTSYGTLIGDVAATGGQIGVYGTVHGSIALTGGTMVGNGYINGTVSNASGTVVPGIAKGIPSVPFSVSRYTQGRSGSLNVALRFETTLPFPKQTVLKANLLKVWNNATLNGGLAIVPPKGAPSPLPVGTQVTILTAQTLSGGFTNVTPGWRLTYTGSPLSTQGRSVVATYIGNGTPPRQ